MSGALALRRRRDRLVELLGTTAPPRLIEVCDAAIAYGQELEEDRGDAGKLQAEINLDLMRELDLVCDDCLAVIEAAMREAA